MTGGFVNFGASSGSSVIVSAEGFPSLNRIIYKDSNWGWTYGWSVSQIYWRSRESATGEAATGRLDIGYLKLRNFLYLTMAGGGNTNGNSKLLKLVKSADNSVLATYTLNTLIGVDTDQLKIVTINTSSIANNLVYLRFEDNDTNSGWAWIGFDHASASISD